MQVTDQKKELVAPKVIPAGSGMGQGMWHNFDTVDGLPGSSVVSILQDREGYLWLGTWGQGFCRYDGMEFAVFSTGGRNNTVAAIHQDRRGDLWFGTGGGAGHQGEGILHYDGENFTRFTAADGLANDTVYSILEDRRGDLWFGTGGGSGISRYDGASFTTFADADSPIHERGVRAIVEAPSGILWFGTHAGLKAYDGEQWTVYTTADGLVGDQVQALCLDRRGDLWIGTNRGLNRYDGSQFFSFTTEDGLSSDDVESIFEDRCGHLWVGTFDAGVNRCDGAGFRVFSDVGAPRGAVLTMLQDREGHLWFGSGGLGSPGKGVYRFGGYQFSRFGANEGADDRVFAVLEDRGGNLWFGTQRGVCRYNGISIASLEGVDKYVRCLLADRHDHLWIGTFNSGAYRYDGNKLQHYTQADGLVHNRVWAMLEDRRGHLWFCTGTLADGVGSGGISRYDGETFTSFTAKDGLPHSWVQGVAEDREGHLWFSTSGGVCRYDGKGFYPFTGENELAASPYTIATDWQGHLLFANANEGIYRYDGKKLEHCATADQLSNNWVEDMTEDPSGQLWVATYGGGVVRFDGRVFQTLHSRDGFGGNNVHQLTRDRSGAIWIATDGGGVTRFQPPEPVPPPVFIDALIADQRYESPQQVEVSDKVEMVAFEFRAISFKTRSGALVYRYRLIGCDREWRTTQKRRIEYQNLAKGSYTFEVEAVDRDLVYSAAPASVELAVIPDPHLSGLTEALAQVGRIGEFVGQSPALARVQALLEEVAPTAVNVLILGETGTGKGLAARTVHRLSQRRDGPFIQINCGALPSSLVESELFGHERGAFTGAVGRRLGKVELARGGTLFLDEIGDMPLEAQVKLLQLLEERTFERVGGSESLRADVRVVAATNRDLQEMVGAGTFRQDLFFRLQVFPLGLPPLRQRREDISLLAIYFMEQMAAHLRKPVVEISPQALLILQQHPWPGNVRELEHAIQRGVIVCRGTTIEPADIAVEWLPTAAGPAPSPLTLEELERRHILHVLEATEGIIKGPNGAAAILGVPGSTLRYRMKKLGIARPKVR